MSADPGSVAGHVVDASGQPVASVSVAVTSSTEPHRDIAALTASDGAFRMSGLLPGQYVLEARQGTATGTAEVDIAAGEPTEVEIRLA